MAAKRRKGIVKDEVTYFFLVKHTERGAVLSAAQKKTEIKDVTKVVRKEGGNVATRPGVAILVCEPHYRNNPGCGNQDSDRNRKARDHEGDRPFGSGDFRHCDPINSFSAVNQSIQSLPWTPPRARNSSSARR